MSQLKASEAAVKAERERGLRERETFRVQLEQVEKEMERVRTEYDATAKTTM